MTTFPINRFNNKKDEFFFKYIYVKENLCYTFLIDMKEIIKRKVS